MRKALEPLPCVEKSSITTDTDKQLVTFKVSEPAKFKIDEAVDKINNDTGFKASLLKAGPGFPKK